MKRWILTIRLETTILSFCSIGIGSALAKFMKIFQWDIFFLSSIVAILLQVICNLANDYGDFISGVDNFNTSKKPSTIQTGLITLIETKNVLKFLIILALLFGILLLWISNLCLIEFCLFSFCGIMAIIAALTYTIGTKPYGYKGLGDLSVFLFFGIIGVGGTFYLHTKINTTIWILPAISYGCLVVTVLNTNNIRDTETDANALKVTIPVKIGKTAAIKYQLGLILLSTILTLVFITLHIKSNWSYLCLVTAPILISTTMSISNQQPVDMTNTLGKVVFLTFVYSILLILVLYIN